MGSRALIAAFVSLCVMLPEFAFSQDDKLRSLRQRAEAGEAKAQSDLGVAYLYGFHGTQPDPAEALKWLRKAADQGDGDASMSIADMYFSGTGVARDYTQAARWYGCPPPNSQALGECREVTYKDLPTGALDLLKKIGCDVSSNYDYGSAVDLNGDGEPEYQICCKDSPHGPCGAVIVGKVGSTWRDLTAKQSLVAVVEACGGLIVLQSRHQGWSDVCLPNQCSAVSSPTGRPCVPTIWQFDGNQYRSVKYTPIPRK
jgi:hypothetical protein